MWLLPSSVSSACAPASVCSTKESLSLSPERGLWVSASGTPTLRPFSWRGWKTRPWSLLLFGAGTWKTPTGPLGAAQWTALRQASPARLSPSPASGKGRTTPDGFSLPSCESFARLEPSGSFLRTSAGYCQQTLDGSLERYSGSWPKAGSMRSGSCYERPTWERRTSGSASSSWPTPDANTATYSNGKRGQNIREASTNWPTPFGFQAGNGPDGNEFSTAVRKWASPNAHDARRPQDDHSTQGANLQREADRWPSPRSEDSESCGNRPNAKDSLTGATKNWPTPAANPQAPNKNSNSLGPSSLGEAADKWPTPASRDEKGANSETHCTVTGGGRKHMDQLSNFAEHSPQAQAIAKAGEESSAPRRTSRPRLNPAFVCWLMGWPWWWTRAERISFGALEMESWRSKLRSRLWSYFGGGE